MGLFLKLDNWHLLNGDTGEQVDGQFPAEDLTKTIGSRWAEKFALNRKNGILQFLHGETEVVSFTATFHKKHLLANIERDIVILERMAVRDRLFARPPILEFWVGDSFLNMRCVMEPITISYERPGMFGDLRYAKISITLRKFSPYSVEETGNFDTRYHPAKAGDYLEMLAWQEYRVPLLGVELARRHPQIRLAPEVGEIVKLPSIEGMRRAAIEPSSIVFTNLSARTDTPQKTLLRKLLAARGQPKISKILQG